jgi:hypothetical protein
MSKILELYEANKNNSFAKGNPDEKAWNAQKRDITPYSKEVRNPQGDIDSDAIKALETKKGKTKYQLGDLGGNRWAPFNDVKKYSLGVKKDK